ncbi:MAG: DNA polymerase III subunit gamma/tau [Planctomycetia bacterium]|nr:DNA polymerase III subunit gamma/tau [Planctomycetia bacterium]
MEPSVEKSAIESEPVSDAGTPVAAAIGYQVVARRYRPQRFDELVGQEHVARGLSGAIESGRIGHAYLFTGARGVGKTSAARIYAKALECTSRVRGEPCNVCDSCAAISAGQDVDVVEIDAASNRGIDEMRQLRQNVAVRPARGHYKTYIIDEVHMLTREAFNALLKTLEEPPAHVKFVLCTTEPDKLPITILSRCQRFDFHSVDPPAIGRRLAQIVEAEGAEVTPDALALIARRAAGSMRDSQSLLEQLLGSADGPIGVDEVHAVIGTGREEKVGAIIACLTARDAPGALAAFDAATSGGADPGGVLEQVMAALRDSLLASVGCGAELMLQGDGLGVDLAAIGRETGTVTLLAMLQIIDHALGRMRSSGHAAVLAEMAIVRLASLEDLDSLADAVERVGSEPVGPAAPAARPAPVARPAEPVREKKTADLTQPVPIGGRPEPVAIKRRVEPVTVDNAISASAEAACTESSVPEQIPPLAVPPATPASPADPLDAWRRGAETVGGLAVDFADLASRAAWRDDVLEVVLPASAGNAASFLRRPEIAAGLTRALTELVGRPVRHSLVIDSSPKPVAAAADSEGRASSAAERGRPAMSHAAMLRDAAEHPMVAHVRTLFDAAVRKVEPPRPRPAVAVQPTVASSAEATARAAVADDDERDHAAADDSEGGKDYGGIDG